MHMSTDRLFVETVALSLHRADEGETLTRPPKKTGATTGTWRGRSRSVKIAVNPQTSFLAVAATVLAILAGPFSLQAREISAKQQPPEIYRGPSNPYNQAIISGPARIVESAPGINPVIEERLKRHEAAIEAERRCRTENLAKATVSVFGL